MRPLQGEGAGSSGISLEVGGAAIIRLLGSTRRWRGRGEHRGEGVSVGLDSVRESNRALGEGERWSEETPHLRGSLGWAGSPSQRLDLNRGWTGGLGSEESHRGCALRQGETKGFDLTMKGEQMT